MYGIFSFIAFILFNFWHILVEESVINKYLTTFFEYNSRDLNSVVFFSTERF